VTAKLAPLLKGCRLCHACRQGCLCSPAQRSRHCPTDPMGAGRNPKAHAYFARVLSNRHGEQKLILAFPSAKVAQHYGNEAVAATEDSAGALENGLYHAGLVSHVATCL